MTIPPTRLKPNSTDPAQAASNRRRPQIRSPLRRLGRKLYSFFIVRLAHRTLQEMIADDATDMAAGVAYYAILSLFPLSVWLITLLGVVLDQEALEGEVFSFFQTYLPGSKELLSSNINAAGNIRGFLGVISFLGVFWLGSLLFGAITRAINRAWDIPRYRHFLVERLRHLLMALSVAPVFLMSISATAALQFLGDNDIPVIGRVEFLAHDVINLLTRILPFLFSMTIFLMLYKFLPNTRTYWRYVWPGALLAAALFEICKTAFVFYLDNFASYERLYGSVTSVVALLAWAYLSGLIIIIGAEFSSEYERMKLGVERGKLVSDGSDRK